MLCDGIEVGCCQCDEVIYNFSSGFYVNACCVCLSSSQAYRTLPPFTLLSSFLFVRGFLFFLFFAFGIALWIGALCEGRVPGPS